MDKARLGDWEDLYRNVWSRPETARYMLWTVTDSEEEAIKQSQEANAKALEAIKGKLE